MKVVYTDKALRDIEEIGAYLAVHYPAVVPAVRNRIHAVVAHIGGWPESARRARGRPGVRVMPLGKYPYKIFYRTTVTLLRFSMSTTLPGSRGRSERPG